MGGFVEEQQHEEHQGSTVKSWLRRSELRNACDAIWFMVDDYDKGSQGAFLSFIVMYRRQFSWRVEAAQRKNQFYSIIFVF